MILCITHSQDFYTIDRVQQHLEKLGYPSWRLNSDEFGTRYQLQYELDNGSPQLYLQLEKKRISAAGITGVWYRKLWALQTPSALDTAYLPVFNREYRTGLHIFFDALKHTPWINNMDADHAVCGNKLLQLQEARQSGLLVPRTLLTNSPGQVRDFYTRCQGNMVMKLHGALSRSMEGAGAFFPTTRVTAQHLSGLDTLAYCPMIFQELVPKAYELRIVYVCGAFYTGKINATQDAGGQTDWRAAGAALPWAPYTLPDTVAAGIHALMQRLNLSFGAIDMIRRPDGAYVFLEVNPQGEWGMLQKHLGYPIAETIAEKLVNKIQHG
jgi:glutathione synthase/RimK-type ligase-like ATP-grasp enzyme